MDLEKITRYKSARSSLLIFFILTIVNAIAFAIGFDINFIYSDLSVAVSYLLATRVYYGLGAALMIFTGVIAPIAILAAAYILSAKSHKAFILAGASIIFDAVKLIGYGIVYYEKFPFFIEVIVDVFIAVLMFSNFKAGKNFQQETGENITDYIA